MKYFFLIKYNNNQMCLADIQYKQSSIFIEAISIIPIRNTSKRNIEIINKRKIQVQSWKGNNFTKKVLFF